MFVFDCKGTLIGNPVLSDEDVQKALFLLKAQGHRIHIWSGDESGIPHNLKQIADSFGLKDPANPPFSWSEVDTVVDDEAVCLRTAVRHARMAEVATVKALSAEQFGLWIADQAHVAVSKIRAAELDEAERKRRVFEEVGVECSCDSNIAPHPCSYERDIHGRDKSCTCCAACTQFCLQQI